MPNLVYVKNTFGKGLPSTTPGGVRQLTLNKEYKNGKYD